jgi:hypothetical protein
LRTRSLLATKQKVPISQGKISADQETFCRKQEKGRLPKKLAPKLKKLELNSTNLRLKCKKRAQIAPKSLIQALAMD